MTEINTDISRDFYIVKMNNGVALIAPEERKSIPIHYELNHTINSLLNLPYNIYFYDRNSSFQLINDACAESCGFNSSEAAINKSILETASLESARIIVDNNNAVLKKHRMKFIEEELFLINCDSSIKGLSLKFPWYNKRNVIIGVFGITVIFGKHKVDELLSQVLDLGLLNQSKYLHNLQSDKYPFTKREKEIIYLLETKNTAKEIGNQLCVSPRTVEKHIENIKMRLNVKSKKDIVGALMNS